VSNHYAMKMYSWEMGEFSTAFNLSCIVKRTRKNSHG